MERKEPTERMVLNIASQEWQKVPDVMGKVYVAYANGKHIPTGLIWELIRDLVDSGLLERQESGEQSMGEVRLTAAGISRRDELNRGQPHATPGGETLHFEPQTV